MSSAAQTVGGLGEAGILRVLSRRFATVPAAGHWPEGTVGPGDDAAVVAAPDGRYVITTDAMAQDRDFRLHWPALAAAPTASAQGGIGRGAGNGGFASGYSIGWKGAAQNLSDVNAMGAAATGLLLALTMPPSTPVGWVDGLAAGIAGAVRHLGADQCRVVGGDLGSDEKITLAITATGDLQGRPAVLRTIDIAQSAADQAAAQNCDLVLCGRAGWAAAGLAVLDTERVELLERLRAAELVERRDGDDNGDRGERGGCEHGGQGEDGSRTVAPGTDPPARGGTLGVRRLAALAAAAQLRPRPVLGAGRRAADAGALAMMDVSDGVAKDAGRLGAANGRRAELDDEWVRVDATALMPLAQALDRDAERWVRTGGEDYGLLAAMPAGSPLPAGFRTIGRLLPATGIRGRAEDRDGGWDHFSGGV